VVIFCPNNSFRISMSNTDRKEFKLAITKLTKGEKTVNIIFDLYDGYTFSHSYNKDETALALSKKLQEKIDKYDKPAMIRKTSIKPFTYGIVDKLEQVPPEASNQLEYKLDESYLGDCYF